MMKSRSMSLLSSITLICWSASAMATPPPNLTPRETQNIIELLRGCDSALEASRKYSESGEKLAESQNQLIQRLQERVQKAESAKMEDNPLLWFVAGMLVTGLTVKLVR